MKADRVVLPSEQWEIAQGCIFLSITYRKEVELIGFGIELKDCGKDGFVCG